MNQLSQCEIMQPVDDLKVREQKTLQKFLSPTTINRKRVIIKSLEVGDKDYLIYLTLKVVYACDCEHSTVKVLASQNS